MSRHNRVYSQAIKIEPGTLVVVTNGEMNCFLPGDIVSFDSFDTADGTYGFWGVSKNHGQPTRQWLLPYQFEQRPEENA